MKKRRVLAGMMALTMALSLAGCGGGSTEKVSGLHRRLPFSSSYVPVSPSWSRETCGSAGSASGYLNTDRHR